LRAPLCLLDALLLLGTLRSLELVFLSTLTRLQIAPLLVVLRRPLSTLHLLRARLLGTGLLGSGLLGAGLLDPALLGVYDAPAIVVAVALLIRR
jgi:hypothetical protein